MNNLQSPKRLALPHCSCIGPSTRIHACGWMGLRNGLKDCYTRQGNIKFIFQRLARSLVEETSKIQTSWLPLSSHQSSSSSPSPPPTLVRRISSRIHNLHEWDFNHLWNLAAKTFIFSRVYSNTSDAKEKATAIVKTLFREEHFPWISDPTKSAMEDIERSHENLPRLSQRSQELAWCGRSPLLSIETCSTLTIYQLFQLRTIEQNELAHHRRIQQQSDPYLHHRHNHLPTVVILHLLLWHEPQGRHWHRQNGTLLLGCMWHNDSADSWTGCMHGFGRIDNLWGLGRAEY